MLKHIFVLICGLALLGTLTGSALAQDVSPQHTDPSWQVAYWNNMNLSGPPVRSLADFFRISAQEVLVIHDDIDLEYGRLKIKEKGGHGGHNGIRSLINAFGGGDFTRLRVGIGRSDAGAQVADYVLDQFTRDEAAELPLIIARARDAVVTILGKGTKIGMNQFNIKPVTRTD
jgi:PTH1 family peptidyl-tRNA hydrolase